MSTNPTTEIGDFFKTLDTNNDGKISMVEFESGWQQNFEMAFADSGLSVWVAECDINHDGEIDSSEFEILLNQIADANQNYDFTELDNDRNDLLTLEELTPFFHTPEEAKQELIKYDTNADGVLSLEEFNNLMNDIGELD